MLPFRYDRPADLAGALQLGQGEQVAFIGGGTNLLDLMKAGIARPQRLIDINHLPLSRIESTSAGGLRIGAGARNSDVANDAQVRSTYSLLSQALLAGASPQLRNMATVGGNLMQRTRCDYFVDTGFAACNKRVPGSGCAAREGDNQLHAILGASNQCVAVNPSDMSVALLALDATVIVRGLAGERRIAMADFHRLPGDHPERDTTLKAGELITAVELPPSRYAANSHYLKVRERASYAFALVSVAVGLELDGDHVRSASIALGGVAHRPWLAAQTAAALVGTSLRQADLSELSASAVQDAVPLTGNGYKIPMLRNAIVQAVQLAGKLA